MTQRAPGNAAHKPEVVNRQMTQLLQQLANREGTHATAVEGVKLMRANHPIPRIAVLYEPSIVIVGQGQWFSGFGTTTKLTG